MTNQDFVFVLTSCIICIEFHMTFPVSIMDYIYDTVWSMIASGEELRSYKFQDIRVFLVIKYKVEKMRC